MKASAALVREKLETALAEVTAAEESLESALRGLQSGLRAEKVTISAALEAAFARVRSARRELANLREQVVDD